ncbi:response regulator [uncultured Jatrophihabitans sp.]|uniref:response regulator n=1 Tax=uncultured Jatrophihabitans sp. TaxID=1610747 RepID=UPI0035C97039
MIQVLIADDQDLVRTGFRLILAAEPDLDVIGEAADGAEAVRLAAQLRPDVVLMDIRMPVLDGIAATRELLMAPTTTRVVILTTFDLDEYVFAALAAGASGFLLKDVKAATLADAIRTVHAGEALLAPSVTKRLIERFNAQQPAGSMAPSKVKTLTEREREVLVMIAGGLSNDAIATALVVSPATVKTHISRIFAKLDIRDRAQAVIAAYNAGLVKPAIQA